jgi:DNA-binding beta-propeller fold protein YncE
MLTRTLLLCLALSQLAPAPAFAQSYAITATIDLNGAGAWDYLLADSANRRLYVSHSADVNVLDLDTQKVVGKLSGFGFVHGILIVSPTLGFISDGGKAEVAAFNPKTLEIKQKIKTDLNPNSLAYDASTQRLFVGHKPTKSMTVLDVNTLKILGSVPVEGSPEFPIADGHGTVYLNIADKSEIAVIDAKTMQVKAHWPLAPCKEPAGLAYSAASHRLFAACDNSLMAVVNADTGKVVALPAIGASPDADAYDPASKLIFSSSDDGTLSILADRGNDKYQVLQTLPTEKGARTMALDAKTHTIYIAAAKLGPPPTPSPDNPTPTHHPTSEPGTFHIIVVKPGAK